MNITRNFAFVAAAATALFASLPPAQSQDRSTAEIDQLVGPIALYPDPLVSVVLPASTMPDDVQQAARTVANGDLAAIDRAPWDDSVRAVAHYPDLVLWLSDNIDWTQQLGATFVAQPQEVLNSIQRLRARARAVGTLVDTPQQRVVIEGNLIAIVPVEATRIYVPRYDPAIVYVDHPARRGVELFAFSAGFATGAWLAYDFDWGHRRVVTVDRAELAHRDWTRPSFSVRDAAAMESRREWHPAANRAQVNVNVSQTVVMPRAMGDRSAERGDRQTNAGERRFREGERAPEANRNQAVLGRNESDRPNTAPPTAAAPAPAPNTTAPSSPSSGALGSTEPHRRDVGRQPEAPAPRPTQRGSITAGSTGEYPRPRELNDKMESTPNSPPSNERQPDKAISRPTEERRSRAEESPSARSGAAPGQPQPASTPSMNSPAKLGKTAPAAQSKSETEDEKAKKQKEEEDKKKKKSDY